MPKSVLILFAHPAFEKSRIHDRLIEYIKPLKGVTFHDLYEAYPDFDIDIKREQELLLQHDTIVWQHPFYWYSCPALMKQWMDLVLEFGWAYGSTGIALQGKRVFNAISCGGSLEAYSPTGRNRFTLNQLLLPFEQTAFLCKMNYLPPFVVPGSHRMNRADMELYASQFQQIIVALSNKRISDDELKGINFLNELCPIPETFKS